MALLELVQKAVAYLLGKNQQTQDELAQVKEELATALANDKADADVIALAQQEAATAKQEAEAAKQSADQLQQAVDADATEDSQIVELLSSVLPTEVN